MSIHLVFQYVEIGGKKKGGGVCYVNCSVNIGNQMVSFRVVMPAQSVTRKAVGHAMRGSLVESPFKSIFLRLSYFWS